MSATKRLWAAGLGLLALVLPAAAMAADRGGTTPRNPNDHRGDTRVTKYCVVATQGIDGSAKLDARGIDGNLAKEIRDQQKSLDEEYLKACQDWKKGKADAAKAHETYTEPKPVQPHIAKFASEELKVKSSYRTQEEAKTAAEAAQKIIDERRAKSEAARAEREMKAAAKDTGGGKEPAKKEAEDK